MSDTIDRREPDWNLLPERMHGGVRRYIEQGIPPGDFLTAVISNDLCEACGRADEENQHLLFEYVKFFYCHAPQECWGSQEKYKAWVQHGGLATLDKDTGQTMSEKKIKGRYFKRVSFNLDHDGSKYINAYSVLTDGEKDTGISVSDSGDRAVPNSNKRTVIFQDEEYPLLRDAIIAYEAALDKDTGK
jgi:hypothetical protein